MSNDATEYCWWIDEMPHGPFPSRDAALEDAADHLGAGFTGSVLLGPIVYVDAAHYVAEAADVDRLMESAEQSFADVCFYEDQAFYVADEAAAQAELRALIEGWARKHVGAHCVWRCPDDAPDVADEVRAMAARLEDETHV